MYVYIFVVPAERVKNDGLKNIVFIPSSYQSSLLLQDNDLTVGTLDKYTEVSFILTLQFFVFYTSRLKLILLVKYIQIFLTFLWSTNLFIVLYDSS